MSEVMLPHPGTGVPYASPVPPGSGWPGDAADAETPIATGAGQVCELAQSAETFAELDARMSVCRACPRLVEWREDVAVRKRRSFAGEPYWGRPVPGFGDESPRLLLVGLAPAANGANRTGRMFTGDQSGDWLFRSLHRVGLAAEPTSVHAADGQRLFGTRMLATVRCAPPANKPTIEERDCCAPWMHAELGRVLPSVRVIVALGGYGWDAALRSLRGAALHVPRPKPKFGHGARATVRTAAGRPIELLGCYHPSQQNTFTGTVTEQMLDDVFHAAREIAGLTGPCDRAGPVDR